MKKNKINVRQKGRRIEYFVRDLFRKEGLPADRVPVSGAARGFKGDVKVGNKLIEIKSRKYLGVYNWLNQAVDGIVVAKANFKPPIVILSWDAFIKILKYGYKFFEEEKPDKDNKK